MITILTILLLTAQIITGECVFFSHGQTFQQGVAVQYKYNNSIIDFTVTVGEVPSTKIGIGFFYLGLNKKFNECLVNGQFISYKCIDKYPDMTFADIFDQRGTILHYATNEDTSIVINNGYGTPVNSTSLQPYLSSQTISLRRWEFNQQFKFQKSIGLITTNDSTAGQLYIAILIRKMRPIGNLTSYLVSDILDNEYYIIANQINLDMPVDDSVCSGYIDYSSVSKWTVFANLRTTRYVILMLISIMMAIIIYYNYDKRVIQDRIFVSTIGISIGLLYTSLGFYFMSIEIELQGVEFAYYTIMALIYFTNFIRYIVRKYLQERAVKFYAKLYTSGISSSTSLASLKNDALDKLIYKNGRMNDLLTTVPRLFINCIIAWLIILILVPTVQIIYYDVSRTPIYKEHAIILGVVKFILSIISFVIPASIIFIINIAKFIKHRSEKLSRQLGRYFGTYDDPLLYRIEFVIAILLVLPIVVLTFIIGQLDPFVSTYILAPKIIHYTFHMIMYTLFDVTYMLLITGLFSLVHNKYSSRVTLSEEMSVCASTIGDSIRQKKLIGKDIVLKFVIGHTTGRDIIRDFSMNTNNYMYYGIHTWMTNLLGSADADQKLGYFFKIYYTSGNGIYKDYSNISNRYGIHNSLGEYMPNTLSKMTKDELTDVIMEILDTTEKYLFTYIKNDGLMDTEVFIDFIDDMTLEIKEFKSRYNTIQPEIRISIIDDGIDIELNDDNISCDNLSLAIDNSE